jgi:glycosyltransferase involved in cell wall biosynthesis
MRDPVLFSVVIPTFNRAAFIGNALRSVISQREGRFEIIVIDDGSIDDTEEIVKQQDGEKIKYFRQENKERGAARNLGVQKASGSFVTFLDSDDIFRENHLSTAADFLDRNIHAEIFHLGYDVVKADGKIIYPWEKLPDPVNEKLVEGNFLSCLGIFIKREILISIPFNEDRDLSGSEDYELWIRLAARFPIRTVDLSTSCLINHESRSVLLIEPLKFQRRIDLLKYYLKKDAKVVETYGSKLNNLFAYIDLYAALHLSISNSKDQGRRALKNAVLAYPRIIWNLRFWVVVSKLIFF